MSNTHELNKENSRIYDGNKYQPPFDPELDAMDGVTDDEMTRRFRMAVRIAVLSKKVKRVPIARFDEESNQAYLEYPDGHREYANF